MMRITVRKRGFEAQVLPQLEDLYRVALYVVDNASIAQDLVLVTFTKAYNSWHASQSNQNCRGWLFSIMASIFYNKHWPTSNSSSMTDNSDDSVRYSMYSLWVKRELSYASSKFPLSAISEDAVKKAIGKLAGNMRLILVLSLIEGFSYREISKIVNIDLEIVRSSLHQSRDLLRGVLFDHVALTRGEGIVSRTTKHSAAGRNFDVTSTPSEIEMGGSWIRRMFRTKDNV